MAKISDENYLDIVNNGDLDNWKEIAAILVTYSYRPEIATLGSCTQFSTLCKTLALRLHENHGDVHSAILVYCMAGIFQEAGDLIAS